MKIQPMSFLALDLPNVIKSEVDSSFSVSYMPFATTLSISPTPVRSIFLFYNKFLLSPGQHLFVI